MPVKVYKTKIPANFEERVEAHRQALLAHRFTVNEAAPKSDPEVEHCVIKVPQGDGKPDDYVSDYVIVDDTPPPPTLEQRKAELRRKVYEAEAKQIDTVMSPGKRRLLAVKSASIMAAATAPGHKTPITKAEEAVLDEEALVKAKILAIQLRGAGMQAEIDDLTDKTISSWAMKPFK